MKVNEALEFDDGNYFDTFSKEQTLEKQIYDAKQNASRLFDEYLSNHQRWNDELTMAKGWTNGPITKQTIIRVGVYAHVNEILEFLKNDCIRLNLIDEEHLKEVTDTYDYLCKNNM